jgi:AraC family transcriptional regulator, regulatory protein of adaptative response / methylated-DNA-[protein]-cysteine methyltransferase
MQIIERESVATRRHFERETKVDSRWQAVLDRDRNADGTFVFSVATTGVYCRPSCASRRAKRENVAFHATPADAERAGFRPCKRCKPNQNSLAQEHAITIAHACRQIENSESEPRLDELAKAAQMSPFHFHRIFRSTTGVTPKQYAAAHRTKIVQRNLKKNLSVTEAIYDAGFNSNSRFYQNSERILGMTPTRFRDGGKQVEIRFAVGESSLGSILVAQSERGVCAILLGDDPDALVRDLQDRFPHAQFVGGDKSFEKLIARVVAFVERPSRGFDLPLDIQGTAFQQRVWRALMEIPCGTVASYSSIAKRIGKPSAARAVAGACAANTLAVAIPCHRVVRNDKSLSGYRWGAERKRELLEREKAVGQ